MKTKENSTLRKSLVIDLEKIKDLYIKQNKTKKIVAAEIGCSEATLGRLLKENDIRKRALDRYQNYNDLRPIIESKVESGMSVGKICEELNITNGTFHNILGDEKIKRNSNKIDESWIDESNSFYWYFLGILFSDGHIGEKDMFISQSNIEYLKDLQARIGHTGTIHKVNSNNDQGGYKLCILSTKLREYLSKYEITSDKRHNIVYAKAPNLDLERSFIRGLFDGDGCIYYAYTSGVFTNKNVSITSGSINLILGVENFCKKYSIECVVRKRVAVNEYYILNIEKFEDIIKFGRTIYNEADFYLKRKYIKFLKFKKLVELDKEVNEIVDGSKKLDVL